MNGMGKVQHAIALVVCATALRAEPILLWDNDIIPDGVSAFQISPPLFPNWRWVDDIIVDSPGWLVQGFSYRAMEDLTWEHSGFSQVYIYEDGNEEPTGPGTYIMRPHERTFTNEIIFGRPVYQYDVQNLAVFLPPGRYWIGARDPIGGGEGTNWLLSSTGGTNGGCPPEFPSGSCTRNYSSDDNGNAWSKVGQFEHLGFHVFGVDGPGDYDADNDVDIDDFISYDDCVTGPDGNASLSCLVFDSDCDTDVDWKDFQVFQLAFANPK